MRKIMRGIMWGLQVIFNTFIFYWTTTIITLVIMFMKNQPKGYGYAVPESEASLHFIMGLVVLIIYLHILILTNWGFYKISGLVVRKYLIITIVEFFVGISLFFLLLGERQLF